MSTGKPVIAFVPGQKAIEVFAPADDLSTVFVRLVRPIAKDDFVKGMIISSSMDFWRHKNKLHARILFSRESARALRDALNEALG